MDFKEKLMELIGKMIIAGEQLDTVIRSSEKETGMMFSNIDYAPVRHGEWEWFEELVPGTPAYSTECHDCGWRCGECKTALEDVVGGYWDNPGYEPKLKYCPNCGAKMDRGTE